MAEIRPKSQQLYITEIVKMSMYISSSLLTALLPLVIRRRRRVVIWEVIVAGNSKESQKIWTTSKDLVNTLIDLQVPNDRRVKLFEAM